MSQDRTKLFISYSHHDGKWFDRLRVHLRPLVRSSTIDVWDDTNIAAGAKWHQEIQAALASAKVAVLLISADFLASDYIAESELPPLLEGARSEGATILPVIVSASGFRRSAELSQFQAVNNPDKPLDSLSEAEQESVFEKVAEEVERALGQQELRAKFDAMHGTLDEQQRQIEAQQNTINELVKFMLSASIFRHLCGIALLREYTFWQATMDRELYFLRDIGFIRPRQGNFVAFDKGLDQRNLAEILEPTPIGWACIRLRKSEIPQDWLQGDNRRANLRPDVAAELGL